MSFGEFKGTDRFEVQGRLGSGTTGEVYRVYDHKQRMPVALKILHKSDPSAIYRFKREFRALADVNHPNLVQLYELLSEDDRWFFTMELVEGLDFIDYTRSQPSAEPYGTGRFFSLPTPTVPSDPERLRGALKQLAVGLRALHEKGKLHCDIKPSNIRVAADGRVVLLDFGLVKELREHIDETLAGEVTGTPAYMAPEQAAGQEVDEASDWYSVGVVLYEALTGRLPYSGGFLKILADKQKNDPPPPSKIAGQVVEDLDELCMSLLSRDPERRPTSALVLEALGAVQGNDLGGRDGHASTGTLGSPFVGREGQLGVLIDAFEQACQGGTEVVLIHGASGMGKSALVQRFIEQLRQERDDGVLLTGRCYERESVPYKALDSLIDALVRYLRRLPEYEAEVLMPNDVLALARLFPALRRVPAVASAHRRVLDIPDSREQRRRAFAALRELLSRLGARRPLVLYIDDLQWGDLDSGALLTELLQPPDPPSLLLLACFRSDERGTSPLLQRLLSGGVASEPARQREVRVEELPEAAARELALEMLGERTAATRRLAETIAHESAGSPFFIGELVRYSRVAAGLDEEGGKPISAEVERALASHMSLDRLIHARLEKLPVEARRLLAVVAVAGRPVELDAVRRAADLGEETQVSLAMLRGASLLRVRSSRDGEVIEPYHDRIRGAVAQGLEEGALREFHHRLAGALEASGRADPETLAFHFFEAGEHERATEFATRAADQASEALAFERAARLYRRALDLATLGGEPQRLLRAKLGDALSNAGRGAEAAAAYLEAAEGARAAEALELRRRAAEQQLISGHIDAGLRTVRTVLASIGMSLPETPRKALLTLIWRLLRLRLRGLDFKERDSTQISAEKLIGIDTCWSVAVGLGTVDTIRGQVFAKQNLLLALEAGEPYRVARALAIEAAYSGANGNRSEARTARLVMASMTLAEQVNHPHALGLTNLTAGMGAYLEGRWRKAHELLERGERTLRESCTGVTWELDTAISFQLRSLLFTGDLKIILGRLPRLLRDAQDRGDLYAETNLRSRIAWVALLVADQPEAALAEVDTAIGRWSQEGFHIQHYWHLTGRVEIALYRGDGQSAWQNLEGAWPKLGKSMLLRIQLTRTEALQLRCRAALAAAVLHGPETADGKRLIAEVERSLRKIESEHLTWADPLAQLLRAGVASLGGDKERALELLVSAAASFESADMALHATVSRRRRGELLGGDGRGFVTEADAWLADQGAVDTARLADVVAPGRWRG